MGDFPTDPEGTEPTVGQSPHSAAGSAAGIDGDGLENASQQEIRKALMRKVAQLTKVVLHLTSLNDTSEKQHEELQEEFESTVEKLVQKATEDMGSDRKKLQDLAEKSCLQENAQRLEELFGQQRKGLADELQALLRLCLSSFACSFSY